MVMRGNSNVLGSLRDFYRNLRENDQFPLKTTCGPDVSSFTAQVDSFIYDSNMQNERGRLLAENIAARKTMVGLWRHENVHCCTVRLHHTDPAAPPESGDREDGELNDKYAEGLFDCEDHSLSDLYIPPGNICFGTWQVSSAFSSS